MPAHRHSLSKADYERLARSQVVPIVDRYDGPATVAAYSVVHAADGARSWGLAVVDLPDRPRRAYGRVDTADVLAAMEADELVGARVTLSTSDDGVNLVTV